MFVQMHIFIGNIDKELKNVHLHLNFAEVEEEWVFARLV